LVFGEVKDNETLVVSFENGKALEEQFRQFQELFEEVV
jgi:hypothetical protein